ncbi:TPA: hypothetical protein HA219_01960 [Candidatus Woesearchaeota archaeon]|nr:hypothetical protein [Candidatus Woesearchaeota archaeon]HIH39465.1 hypothetical protein [Candidatus Woesearchaeota archaeon]
MNTNIAIAGGIVLAAVVLLIVNVQSPDTAYSNLDLFAKCLTENNAVFYGASWCSHCNNQKNMLGSSMSFIRYVECSASDGRSQTEICRREGINAYPTWKFSGKAVEGELDLTQLSQYSGCSLDLIA